MEISGNEVRELTTSLFFKQNHYMSHDSCILEIEVDLVSFYLGDLNQQYLDISSWGPVVAAQVIIPSASTPTSDEDLQSMGSRKSNQKKKGGGSTRTGSPSNGTNTADL